MRRNRQSSATTVVTAKQRAGIDGRLPVPGTVLCRPYKGKEVRVKVQAQGIEYEGNQYPSLSAVAKAITGSHTNGFLFFRLGKYQGGKA